MPLDINRLFDRVQNGWLPSCSPENYSDFPDVDSDDLETFVNLELENGGAKTISRLEINQTCVNTSDVSVTF